MKNRVLWWRLTPDRVPEPAPDNWYPPEEWWATGRRVNETLLFCDVRISTVFLAIDHNYSDTGPPLLFETMIFGGTFDQTCWRYATWQEAVEGHKKAVRLAYTQFTGEEATLEETSPAESSSGGRSIDAVPNGQHDKRTAKG
jgi:hypothetical protein